MSGRLWLVGVGIHYPESLVGILPLMAFRVDLYHDVLSLFHGLTEHVLVDEFCDLPQRIRNLRAQMLLTRSSSFSPSETGQRGVPCWMVQPLFPTIPRPG